MAEEKTQESNGAVARKLLDLLDLPNIGELEKALANADPALSRPQVTFLLGAENSGKTRKGAVAALDAALERIAASERAEAEEARRLAIEEAEARLLRFGVGGPLAEGADASMAARTGPTFLVLGDGGKEIAGLNRIAAAPAHYTAAGAQVMYGRPIRISGADVKAKLESVALVDEEGAIHGVCEIPGGLQLGGRDVEMPAGSLIFGI